MGPYTTAQEMKSVRSLSGLSQAYLAGENYDTEREGYKHT